MGKKKKKKINQPPQTNKEKVAEPKVFRWTHLVTVLAITFVCLYPSLHGDILHFDDGDHVVDNLVVRNFDSLGLKGVIKDVVNQTYIPLTTLSFAIEYKFVQNNPFLYHLNNLLLHLAIVALVYLIGLKLGFSSVASFLAALLFGIHPMHVESVAWITERKDVLYGFFYLLSVLTYLKYIKGENRYFYSASIVFAFLSILSKPMALSLPLILFLIDYYVRQKISRKIFIEKIPFVVICASIAWITYSIQFRTPEVHLVSSSLLWLWCLTFYLKKFFLPLWFIPLYGAPLPVTITNYHYIVALIITCFLIWLIVKYRHNRLFMFGFLFFFLSTFFLYRYDLRDLHFVADRFMYLPSIGICFVLGKVFTDQIEKKGRSVIVMLLIVFSFLGIKTFNQTKIWNNDLDLWDYSAKKNPEYEAIYERRSSAYIRNKQYALAIRDLDKALAIVEKYNLVPGSIYNRYGNVYFYTENFSKALENYDKAIYFNDEFYEAYLNRGVLYHGLGELDRAVEDYSRSIELRPGHDVEPYNNRGAIYAVTGRFELALKDFNKSIELDPSSQISRINKKRVQMDMRKDANSLKTHIQHDPTIERLSITGSVE